VARVGGEDITASDVARIAAAQGIDASRALQIAVRDALFAREAGARGLADAPAVRASVDAELARRLLRRVVAEARAAPPTEEELAAAAARKWLDVDRPEGVRVVHAVVRFDPQKDDDAKKARAREVAEAIRAAVRPIAEQAAAVPLPEGAPAPNRRIAPQDDPDPLSGAFRRVASAVPHDGVEVVVEPLPPVAADGRLLVPGNEAPLDRGFAEAAFALPARGALSPITASPFGLHVILLLERTPPSVLTGEARRARLLVDVVNERARAADKKLLARWQDLRAVAPDAPGLLDLVTVEP
jgi:peptidyl-prolyl cis-trans isomerase C